MATEKQECVKHRTTKSLPTFEHPSRRLSVTCNIDSASSFFENSLLTTFFSDEVRLEPSNVSDITIYAIMSVLTLVFILVLAMCACASIFDYEVIDVDGNAVSLSKYKSAKAILIG